MITKFEIIIGVELYPFISNDKEKELYFKISDSYKEDKEECQKFLKELSSVTNSVKLRTACIQNITLIKEGIY